MPPLLCEFAPDVWEYSAPLRVLGIEMGHRMTVVRLGDGSLWVHSPVAWSEELEREIRALGDPTRFAAPSRMHDGFWPAWFERFPQAEFSAAPGVAREHPELRFTVRLGDETPGVPGGELQARWIRGMPVVNEVVFLHGASRTLIVADLIFNLDPPDFLSRLMLRLNGALARPTPSRMFKMAIRDKAAFRESLDSVLAWDFDRVIVGHGANVGSAGKDVLRTAFAFLK